jgi:SAM-dependent methyltransferase
MMAPLWQRVAQPRWAALLIGGSALALAMWASPPARLAGVLVVGCLLWRADTAARLTVCVALLWPLVLTAVAAHTWPWAEVVVLASAMLLSEAWPRRRTVRFAEAWQPIGSPTFSPVPGWLIAMSAWYVTCGLRTSGSGANGSGVSAFEALLLANGLLLVVQETGQVRRTVISICGSWLVLHGLLATQPTSVPGWSLLGFLPLTVPVVRAGGVPVACLLPGAVGVALLVGGGAWAPPVALPAAMLVGGWLWDQFDYPVRPSWRILPPSWRWFTCAKFACDPVYGLLAADTGRWGRVLDLGCGNGLAALVAARRTDVEQWSGIDLDARKIAVARTMLAATPGTAIWRTLVARLPLPATSALPNFDTVLAIDILHYWPPAEQAELLVWMRKHLTPSGRLWLREGASDAGGSEQVQRGERFTTAIGLNPASVLFFRTTSEWEAAFAAAGLIIRSCQPAGAANRLWCLSAAPGV